MEQKELKSMNYIGSSMNPTLKPGDRLDIHSSHWQDIRRGDVIVFISPTDESKAVHRVILVDSNGLRTRGDNCNRIDPWGTLRWMRCAECRRYWPRTEYGPTLRLF